MLHWILSILRGSRSGLVYFVAIGTNGSGSRSRYFSGTPEKRWWWKVCERGELGKWDMRRGNTMLSEVSGGRGHVVTKVSRSLEVLL
jgi:hypothetical protein